MLNEVRKQQGNAVLLRVKVMVGHPWHIRVVVGEVAPIGAVANHGVTVGVEGVEVGRHPFGQGDPIGVCRRGQRDDRQVRPVVLQQLSGHQTTERHPDQHGTGGEFFSYGENGGVVFVCRGGRKVEKGDLRRVGQAGEHRVPQQLDGAVRTPTLAVHEEDVNRHRSHRALPQNPLLGGRVRGRSPAVSRGRANERTGARHFLGQP
jgi:hypothetical protein